MHIGKLNNLFLLDLLVEDIKCLSGLKILGLKFTFLVPAYSLVPTSIQFSKSWCRHVHIIWVLASQRNLYKVLTEIIFFIRCCLLRLSWIKRCLVIEIGCCLWIINLIYNIICSIVIHLDILQSSTHKHLILVLLNKRTKFIKYPVIFDFIFSIFAYLYHLNSLKYPIFIKIWALTIRDRIAVIEINGSNFGLWWKHKIFEIAPWIILESEVWIMPEILGLTTIT